MLTARVSIRVEARENEMIIAPVLPGLIYARPFDGFTNPVFHSTGLCDYSYGAIGIQHLVLFHLSSCLCQPPRSPKRSVFGPPLQL
jgi:hypothetical protein